MSEGVLDIFMHVPKTGGTTINEILKNNTNLEKYMIMTRSKRR